MRAIPEMRACVVEWGTGGGRGQGHCKLSTSIQSPVAVFVMIRTPMVIVMAALVLVSTRRSGGGKRDGQKLRIRGVLLNELARTSLFSVPLCEMHTAQLRLSTFSKKRTRVLISPSHGAQRRG